MRRLVALGLLVLVTGCGGGGGASDDSGGSRFSDAMEVARAGGCTEPTQVANADLEFYVTSAVDCTINGHDVTVNWFNSRSTRDSYKKVADSFGGSGAVYGDDWAFECPDDQQDCDDFKAAVD